MLFMIMQPDISQAYYCGNDLSNPNNQTIDFVIILRVILTIQAIS